MARVARGAASSVGVLMPYTAKQNRVFRAIAHGWRPRKGSLASISQGEAAKMADEGVKRNVDHEIGRAIKHVRRKHKLMRSMGK